MEGPIVLFGRSVAIHRFEERDGEFRSVRPIIERIPRRGLRRSRCGALRVRGEVRIVRAGHLQVARQNVEDASQVRGTLYVRVTAKRIDASTGPADISHQELYHGCRSDDLRSEAVLSPAHRIDDSGRLFHVAVSADRGEEFSRFEELVFRNTGDTLNNFRRVSRILLFQKLINALRMLERQVIGHVRGKRRCRCCTFGLHTFRAHGPAGLMALALSARDGARLVVRRSSRRRRRMSHVLVRDARGNYRLTGHVPALLIVPRRFIVDLGRRIKAGIEAVFRQLESFLDKEGCVGVVSEIFLGDTIVLDDVVDDTAEEGDIRAGSDLEEQVRSGRSPREARVHHDHLSIAGLLCFDGPLKTTWVVFSRIATHD